MPQTPQTELLTHILNVSQQMIAHRSLEPLLNYALDEVLALVGGETGSIILVRPDQTLDFHTGRDETGQNLAQKSNMLSESIVQEVVQNGKSLVLSNALQHPRFANAPSVMHYRLRSIMCVPLTTINGIIGAIYLENRSIANRFTISKLPPLEILANQVAVAIENALLNDQLAQANRHLQELDKIKNDFIMLIAHELNTPLTGVKAYTQLIRKLLERSPDVVAQAYKTSLKLEMVVENMNATIQEILQMVKISSGKLGIRPTAVSITNILTNMLTTLTEVLQQRQLTVTTAGLEKLPPVEGDAELLRMALHNVLGNAIKFTPNGGWIQINGRFTPTQLELTIQDGGIGILPKEQTRIFDLFHAPNNLNHHSTSKYAFRGGGLALGLPITKGIVEAHQGSIQLTSPGYDPETLPGTTCIITLPLTQTQS